MDLGKKVVILRKKNNLTQESLAEKIGVTRQTISKWELGETSPDIKQAKLLAAEFNISLDELVNNNTNNVLMKKVSNTEHLATITIKMLKVIGIILSVLFITIIIYCNKLFILLNMATNIIVLIAVTYKVVKYAKSLCLRRKS